MRLTAYNNILNISSDQAESFSFDASGRLHTVHNGKGFVQRGLDGRMVIREWHNGRKHADFCLPDEPVQYECQAKVFAEKILEGGLNTVEVKKEREYDEPSCAAWIERVHRFDYSADVKKFKQAYRVPVGILPPDHYLPVVIQLTEGCIWNRCSFCNFYKQQSFKKKSRQELAAHIEQVRSFFGEGISVRNSIFLGEANCLTFNAGDLAGIIRDVCRDIGYAMPDFRGVSAFVEPFGADGYRTKDEFAAVAEAGMTCVYAGLETGDENLRRRIKKSCSASVVSDMVRNAKQGGLSVGVIVLLGIGGKEFDESHVRETLNVIRELDLDSSDMVFLSPLIEHEGCNIHGGHEPMTWEEMAGQYRRIRQGLPTGIRSSLYEIEGFVY